MTPADFEAMTNAELRTYAIAHRDDLVAVRTLFSRRSPNATKYSFPDTEEGREQLMEFLRRKIEESEGKLDSPDQ
ncbi:MAG: hypothetical protein HC860_13145 [Alkalinema sp. RU_4_3]|nr:hypothetical protein [Alkalinema sp. RU_4_3]